jgi:(1->4)-alpha-D-glucan 1-alpha-D-glucosylmutase
MFITACGLRLRRREHGLFTSGTYLPLAVRGEESAHVVAFAKIADGRAVVVAVPRLVAAIATDETGALHAVPWSDTRVDLPPPLADMTFVDALTGARLKPADSPDGAHLPVDELFRVCPAAVLVSA